MARALNGDLNQFAESHWIIDATQKFVLKIWVQNEIKLWWKIYRNK